MRSEEEMFGLTMNFALNCEKIRLFTLEGSRANPNIPKDEFQDYDFSYFLPNWGIGFRTSLFLKTVRKWILHLSRLMNTKTILNMATVL